MLAQDHFKKETKAMSYHVPLNVNTCLHFYNTNSLHKASVLK